MINKTCKKITLIGAVLVVSTFTYAGGDDRDLGPVEVLDLIVETQDKVKIGIPIVKIPKVPETKAIAKVPEIELDKIPAVVKIPKVPETKAIAKVPEIGLDKIPAVVIPKAAVEAVSKVPEIDINKAIIEVKDNEVAEVMAVTEELVKTQKVIETPKALVEKIAEVAKVKKPVSAIKVKKPEASNFANKPIGHPTAPIVDVAPKIYKTCEDMIKSDNVFIQNACSAIIGVLILF